MDLEDPRESDPNRAVEVDEASEVAEVTEVFEVVEIERPEKSLKRTSESSRLWFSALF